MARQVVRKPHSKHKIKMVREYKVILAIIRTFGGTLSRKMLQKLMFLYCDRNMVNFYEFIPYKYGCYSAELASAQSKLIEKGFLKRSEDWSLRKQISIDSLDLCSEDIDNINALYKRFRNYSEYELIKYVYLSYPFFAINSVIAKDILTKEELKPIIKLRNKVEKKALYSIGYEGLSLDSYISKILSYDVRIVCDVRKNPISRKYGFSKGILSKELYNAGVKYIHFPELGIPSALRQNLKTQEDYDLLFDHYERTILPANLNKVEVISDLLDSDKRIALLCFEKNPLQCHRTRIANKILEYRENDIDLISK